MSQSDADDLWAKAVEHHVAGRLPDAERLYQQLVDSGGGSARVLHMLGMAEFQQGRGAAGLASVESAIALEPGVARYHAHRGLILASMGNTQAAIQAYRSSLAIDPGSADTWNNLGAAMQTQGDTAGAIEAYRRALQANPAAIQAAANLGSLLTNSGEHAEAVDVLESAAARAPDNESISHTLATALCNLGGQYGQQGDIQHAIALLKRALELQPRFAQARFNLGKALTQVREIDQAIASYRQAISDDPKMADAYNNIGILLSERGQIEKAIAQYREALRLDPNHTRAMNNLGNALRSGGKLQQAETCYRQGIRIDPGDAELWSNLGVILSEQEKLDEALEALGRAVALRPGFSQAQNNIGNARKALGDIEGAIAAYQLAVELAPDNQAAHSNRLYTMYFHPDFGAERIAAEHRSWNATYAAPLRAAIEPRRHSHWRLRVGYVAPYFRDHCQSFFTMPLLANHDHGDFEVFAYSDVAVEDAVTRRLRGYADVWRNIHGLSDKHVTEMVRRDGIDVLVDLSLHMSENRLLVFARKPAPLQVTWLGYPGTTGLDAIDYRLTDPFLDPVAVNNDAHYSERSYRLPDTFWCYDPLEGSDFDGLSPGGGGIQGSGNAAAEAGCVSELPGASNGFVTFGCLNNFCKVNEQTLDLWAAVLRAVPTSRFLLLAPRAARARVLDVLLRGGVRSDRVDFVDRMPRYRYLASYHRIDIGLDTIPYNGHTTTLDALWMGVPVVTLIGNTPVSRAGWSQLNNLGMQSLATSSPEEFVQAVASLCADLERLRKLRASLRNQLASSPLMDGKRFARNVEAAYRAMWDKM